MNVVSKPSVSTQDELSNWNFLCINSILHLATPVSIGCIVSKVHNCWVTCKGHDDMSTCPVLSKCLWFGILSTWRNVAVQLMVKTAQYMCMGIMELHVVIPCELVKFAVRLRRRKFLTLLGHPMLSVRCCWKLIRSHIVHYSMIYFLRNITIEISNKGNMEIPAELA